MCLRDGVLRISLHPLSLPSGVVSNDSSPTDTAESIAAHLKPGLSYKLIPLLRFEGDLALIALLFVKIVRIVS